MTDRASWYADGLRFTCTQCGNCCTGAPGHVWVDPADIEAIAAHRGLTPEEFARVHTRIVGERRSLNEHANGDCEFLVATSDGRRVCGIYEVRPVQCRTWPFWRSNLTSQRQWQASARTCPGMNHGTLHPLPVIHAALAANAARGVPL